MSRKSWGERAAGPPGGARLDRRLFLTGLGSAALGSSRAAGQVPGGAPELRWHDPRDWGVEGRGWSDTARYYDRLPARAERRVRQAVWDLSRHSAGMLTRFRTDAAEIHVRYRLLSDRIAMPHMPATGVSGVDLYARDEGGSDRWVAVARPAAQDVTQRLAAGLDLRLGAEPRLFTLYLPLYNGVERLEIGIPKGARFEPVGPPSGVGARPIVFYGTSIMHGACASRPGMAIPALVGRALGLPTLNLGFSGNGRMEKEVGEFLAELDAGLYAIDCLPNMTADQVRERAVPLVRQLRESRPETPILLVEDRTFTNAGFFRSTRVRHQDSRQALREAYQALRASGVRRLHLLKGEELLGDDGEAATDGSHPSDLGMLRYVEAYLPALRNALGLRTR